MHEFCGADEAALVEEHACLSARADLPRNFFKALPVVWKTALCFLGPCLVELFFIGGIGLSAGAFAFGWFVEKLLLGGAAVCLAFTMRSLKKGRRGAYRRKSFLSGRYEEHDLGT